MEPGGEYHWGTSRKLATNTYASVCIRVLHGHEVSNISCNL